MLAILGIVFLVLLTLGVPIAFSMGLGSAAAILYAMPHAVITIPARMFGGLDSFALMAIPFFILAGNLMDSCGISRRLVDFADVLVGRLRGGLAMATVVASVIFSSIVGSAAAATVAIGAILISSLIRKGYPKGFAASLVASGGMMGPILPPSILAIIYSSATGLSIGALFMAGIAPGLLMAVALMITCIIYVRRHPEINDASDKKPLKESLLITFRAMPAFLVPIIIIGGILSGVFTATESGAIACVYSIAYGFASRSLSVKAFWKVLGESAVSVAKLMIIIACATLFGWILSVNRFPQWVTSGMMAITDNPWVMLSLVILMLLIVGLVMETIALLNIIVPVLFPLGLAFGFDSIHFAMVVILTILFGAITPPVGMLLFISSGIARIKFTETLRYMGPFLLALFIVVLLVAFVPPITTFIPNMLGFR
jgi:C4-dicarboxylate transporter DctM subunit